MSLTRIIAISASLRETSANAAVIRCAVATAPPSIAIDVFAALRAIPLYNADLPGEGQEAPTAVRDLRRAIARADAVLISTPEYGHSLPGVLKNALDWLVGSGELANKRVAVISASPTPTGGLRALTALVQTLLGLQADIVALLPLRRIRTSLDMHGNVVDPVVCRRVSETVTALADPP